jgi:predicted PurR-regulated permease PerM
MRATVGTPSGGIYDFLTTCKLPHGLAVVATILIVGALMVALGLILSSEVGVLLEDEDFVASIDAAVDDAYNALNESGVKVLRSQGNGKWSVEELQAWANVVSGLVNQLVLVFLLAVYLLMVNVLPQPSPIHQCSCM